MPDTDPKISGATKAAHEGQERSDVKRRALFGMITKTAFVAPVVASFALDSLSLDKAHALTANGSGVAILSDIRLKKDIRRIGTHSLGIGLYEYSYLGSNIRHTGVMAQEVLRVAPHAVITGANGFYSVDYSLIGL
ncbi:MAG: hypothetical protein B7Z75_06495 [Acidocella sp. 20-57-95]|nr:MAG: hypothetical protein B7Z75_06495 [Acidocella sp. 20-57-95]HQT64791.1 tail fiber domain-containing protein [Acidocella sp.]